MLRELYLAGVAAVDPAAAVRRAVVPITGGLRCGGVDHPVSGRARVAALGKAAGAMAAGLLPLLDEAGVAYEGVIVTDRPVPDAPLPVVVGGHPDPTPSSIDGARRILDLARAAMPADLMVVLLSGGGSALATLPAPGLTLDDVAATAAALMCSGAGVTELNCVRKHLSGFSGGRLADACRGSRLLTLVVSDVVGDALDVIASGPTVPDPTTYADALAVLRRRGVAAAVPPSVIAVLREGAAGARPETPEVAHPRQQVEIVASGAVAAEGAAAAVRARGLRARVVTVALEGEARRVAGDLVGAAEPGMVLIAAGETTVTVIGRGRGGRNQEAALAAAIAAAGSDITFLAAGTDGIDGPTPAAGAVVDGTTAGLISAAGMDPVAALSGNDSHTALGAAGALITIGATGTNVGDLWLVHKP